MTKPQIKIVNAETNEEVIRDATAAEIAQMKLDAEQSATEKTQAEAKATAKAALLTKLGISESEARLLLS
jgi:hypothetical protein